MTIAAGFRCVDGILLCADTQFTAADKTYREKIVALRSFRYKVMFAFSGDEDYAKSAIEDCEEAIERIPEEDRTKSTVRKAIIKAVSDMSKDYSGHGGDPSQKPEFLVSVSTSTGGLGDLFSCRESAMSPVSLYTCIGSGNYIGNYVYKAFGYGGIGCTIREAIPRALHVITAAGRHDLGSGGGYQFMFVRGMASTGVFYSEVGTGSDYIKEFEFSAGQLLSSIGNEDLSDDEFNLNVDRFADRAKQMRLASRSANSSYHFLIQSADALPRHF